MMLSKKLITKALIRLRGSAGCSVPVLFANPRRQGFSHQDPYISRFLQLDHMTLAGALALPMSLCQCMSIQYADNVRSLSSVVLSFMFHR